MQQASVNGDFEFETRGSPPERYMIEIHVTGLAVEAGHVVTRSDHRCEAYLHHSYPRRPPVVTWQTPVLHPNLLGPDRNGGVCIGEWSASESLADLVVRLTDLVSFKAFSTADALDRDAAEWTASIGLAPGCDLSELVASEPPLPRNSTDLVTRL
jgi:hypothetical protein